MNNGVQQTPTARDPTESITAQSTYRTGFASDDSRGISDQECNGEARLLQRAGNADGRIRAIRHDNWRDEFARLRRPSEDVSR